MVSHRCRSRILKKLILSFTIATGGILLWITSRRLNIKRQKFDNVKPVSPELYKISPDRNVLNYTVVQDIHPVASSDYFIPRETIVNPIPSTYLVQPKNLCSDRTFLVIIVCSVYAHTNVRTAIRETWGSVARGHLWPGTGNELHVKLLFLFGKPTVPAVKYLITQESNKHNDVLAGDFVDSYRNLTIKSLTGLRYVSESCPDVQYVLKADEDTFTNVHTLYEFLETVHPVNSVIGHIYNTGPVQRHGAWAVSKTVYPHNDYPYYASGNTYVLSRDLIGCINNSSGYLPFLPIEDVFVTGIMGVVCHADLIHVQGFTNWQQHEPEVEDMVYGEQVTANRISPGLAKEIWQALVEGKENV